MPNDEISERVLNLKLNTWQGVITSCPVGGVLFSRKAVINKNWKKRVLVEVEGEETRIRKYREV